MLSSEISSSCSINSQAANEKNCALSDTSVKIGGLGDIYTLNNHRYGTTIQTAYLQYVVLRNYPKWLLAKPEVL